MILLDSKKLIKSTEVLRNRINERFPSSSLADICSSLKEITTKTSQWQDDQPEKKIVWIRVLAISLIVFILIFFVSGVVNFKIPKQGYQVFEFIQLIESTINDIIFFGIGIFFLFTYENRVHRKVVMRNLADFRSLAHVIDMHQLTKDPEKYLKIRCDTESSPKEELTPYELSRYLDYCCEMLALIGKNAAIYAQHFDDATIIATVNEVESLTSSLSEKIWQKMSFNYQYIS